MLRLTEKTAAEIDILLKELLKEKANPYHGYIDLDILIQNNPIYKGADVEYLKSLLYLTMVEQKKENLPIMIRGAKKPCLMDNGEPIRDFLDSGGFKTVWNIREGERKVSRNRYWWTNGLVILGIIVTIGVSLKWNSFELKSREKKVAPLRVEKSIPFTDSIKKNDTLK